jgi:hypothetical protein
MIINEDENKICDLISVRPGAYMKLLSNSIMRLQQESIGLNIGQRCSHDDYSIVLLNDELIIVPNCKTAKMEKCQ